MGFVRRAVIYATAKSLRERGHHRNSDTRALYIEFFHDSFGSDQSIECYDPSRVDKLEINFAWWVIEYWYTFTQSLFMHVSLEEILFCIRTHTYTQVHILFIIKYSTISSMWLDLEIKNAYLFNFDHKKLNNFNALRISICRN